MTEVSVVIPCLNEADTLGECVDRARRGLAEAGVEGEVVVADNGSEDGSVEIAEEAGARVVHVARRGYGSALMAGIEASRGTFVIMGDADMSYDFLEIPRFVAKYREGFELVQGCRLPSGGGTVSPGAMPPLHRWVGNPLFSVLARRMFKAPIHDVYCGLRGFRRDLYDRLEQRCTGMEFAVEMIVKSSLAGAKTAEVPITLHPDKRVQHAPHLRTYRDGWRTLRFFLLYSPRWLFLYPGLALMAFGAVGYAVALPGVQVFGATFDAHTLLVSSLAILCGYQACLISLFARTYAVNEGLTPPSPILDRFHAVATLERGLAVAIVGLIAGGLLIVRAFVEWHSTGYGGLDYAVTMRWVIPGVTLFALAFQTLLSSFLVSLLGMGHTR